MRLIAAILCFAPLWLSGCTVVDATKSAFGGKSASANDDESGSKKQKDDWVNHKMRGDRPLETENDPTKKWFYSEKHLEIERSLGVGE